MADRLRVLELFSGIGGCAAAIGDRADVVTAVDTDSSARSIYQHNFTHQFSTQPIESLSSEWFQDQAADIWWLSPPTLPLVHAGLRRELDDLRAKAFLHVAEQIRLVKPQFVVLESVLDFNKSLARQALHDTLSDVGYQWQETTLCPTELGMHNKRPRFYLVAGRQELRPWKSQASMKPVLLTQTLDKGCEPDLYLAPELLAMHRSSIDVVDVNASKATTACFTSDYGRSVNKTGSYLQETDGVRYFSPSELLRQLGFPEWFKLPDSLDRATAWRLIGNSSSVPAVRVILDAISGLFSRNLQAIRTSQRLHQSTRNR